MATVVLGACSTGAAKLDVADTCRPPISRAELELTAGQVVPSSRAESLATSAARLLYESVCTSFVTAPAAPHWNDAHGCPEQSVDPGTASVVFFDGKREVDRIAIDVSGCRAMRSPRLGSLPEFEQAAPVFAAAERTIQRAFGVTPADFGGDP